MAEPQGTEIKDPRRLLVVAQPESTDTLSKFIKDLSGNYPVKPAGSDTFAGTTHTLPITNAYYNVQVPVWLDLVENPEEWERNFLSEEAKEVLDVLGGVIVVFELPSKSTSKDKIEATKKFIDHIGHVVEDGLGGIEWDGVTFAVGVGDLDFEADGQAIIDEWDDACQEYSLEFIHLPIKGKQGRGRFSREMDEEEPDHKTKEGLERALEMLHHNDWSLSGVFSEDEDEDGERPAIKSRRPAFDDWDDSEFSGSEDEGEEGSSKKVGALGGGDVGIDPEKLGFGFDKDDFTGLRQAILEAQQEREGEEGEPSTGKGGEAETEEDVEKMEAMMRKLLAVREATAGMPEAQRKRMAKRAVDEVMKDL